MASVSRSQGLPCAGYRQFQPAPKWTHCRIQLSLSEQLVVSLGERI